MSLKTTIAALAAAFVLPSAAIAAADDNKCDDIFQRSAIENQLFNMPVAKWPLAKIGSFGPAIVESLRNDAQTVLPKQLASESTLVLKSIEASRSKGTEPNWDYVMRRTHMALHPLLEDVQSGKTTLEDARAKAPVISAQYVLDATKALNKVPANAPQFCLAP